MGPKTKIYTLGELFKLSSFDSSRKDKKFKKRNVKIGWKITELCQLEGHALKWQLAYFFGQK